MKEIQIAWLELIMVGSLGIILIIFGIIRNIMLKRKYQLCTMKTEGIVIKHKFPGDEKMFPVIEYTVDGNIYHLTKKFAGFKIKRISGLPIQTQPKVYEDHKGWLHIEIGPLANLRKLANEIWPINSVMTVYYNPNNPKMSYANKPILNDFASKIFIISGLVIVALSILIFVLMQL